MNLFVFLSRVLDFQRMCVFFYHYPIHYLFILNKAFIFSNIRNTCVCSTSLKWLGILESFFSRKHKPLVSIQTCSMTSSNSACLISFLNDSPPLALTAQPDLGLVIIIYTSTKCTNSVYITLWSSCTEQTLTSCVYNLADKSLLHTHTN